MQKQLALKPLNMKFKLKFVIVIYVLFFSFNLKANSYFWVGGSGVWGNVNNWATTSGGLIKHSVVPSINDDVFFDLNSGLTVGNNTVTVDVGVATCRNISFNAVSAPKFTGNSYNAFRVSGSMTLQSGMIYEYLYTEFVGNTVGNTITTNGTTFLGPIQIMFNGDSPSASWILQDNFDLTTSITGEMFLYRGVLNTNNKTLSVNCFSSGYSCLNQVINPTNLILGSSTINCQNSWSYWGVLASLNSGTSNIVLNGSNPSNFITQPGHTYFNVTFSSATTASVNGTSFNSVICNSDANFSGSAQFNNLTFSSTHKYVFETGTSQTINNSLSATSIPCIGLIELVTNKQGSSTVFNFPGSATASLSNIMIRDIVAIGPSIPISITGNSFDLGGNSGFIFPLSTSRNLFWVGGSGNWNDVSHWSNTSGGSGGECIPSPIDNVTFNSLSGIGSTNLNGIGHYCNDITFLNSSISSIQGGTLNPVYIYGSVVLNSSLNYNILKTHFKATTSGKTITSNNCTLNGDVYFDGFSGGWTLLDDFSVAGNFGMHFNNGTFNSNSKTINTGHLTSGLNFNETLTLPNSSTINLANSNVYINISELSTKGWTYQGNGAFLNAGTSHIIMNSLNPITPQFFISEAGHNFYRITGLKKVKNFNVNNGFVHRAVFKDDAILVSNTRFDSLIVEGDIKITMSSISTNTIIAAFISTNTPCSSKTSIESSINGQQCTLSFLAGSSALISQTLLQDIKAIGAITPINTTNSFDIGNNTGFLFSPTASTNLYWIGGSGNFNDPTHWSYTSGGGPAFCTPGPADDVFFDVNSFNLSTSKTVSLSTSSQYCRNMTWSGALFNPELVGPNPLFIYGSLTLQPIMGFTVGGNLYFNSNVNGQSITTNSITVGNDVFFQGKGSWALLDDFKTLNDIYLFSGHLNTNGKNLDIRGFSSGKNFGDNVNLPSTCTLSLGSSTINITQPSSLHGWNYKGSGTTLNAGSSHIIFSNIFQIFSGQVGHSYNNVIALRPLYMSVDLVKFHNVYFKEDATVIGNVDFDTLLLNSGRSYVFNTTNTVTIHNQLIMSGSPCAITFLRNTDYNYGNVYLNVLSGDINYDYVSIDHYTSIGLTLNIGGHSTDNGGNMNFNFAPPAPVGIIGLGPDVSICENNLPYSLNTSGFYPNIFTQFNWQGGVTTPTFTVSSGGNYSVAVTYASNCTLTDDINVTIINSPTITANSISNVKCYGLNTASISVTANGGVPNYTYNWMPIATSSTNEATSLSVGNYTLTIVDSNNCIDTKTFVITGPTNSLSVSSYSYNSVNCFGASTASAQVFVNGGTGPYAFIWSPNVTSTTNIATGLSAANYSIYITDANNCNLSGFLTISEPSSPINSAVAQISPNTNCVSPNGVATVTVVGGTPSYTINWSTGAVGTTASNLNTGINNFNVTDANSCAYSGSVNITGAAGISMSVVSQNSVSCFGGSNGLTSYTTSGGGIINYTLTNISTGINTSNSTGLFSGLASGNYSTYVIGSGGCTDTDFFSITQPSASLTLASVATQSVNCFGATATVTLNASGGTSPYTYNWQTPSVSTNSLSSYQAGTYTANVTDGNNCASSIQTITINQPSIAVSFTAINTSQADCGLSNGTATLLVSGGWSSVYSYSLNNTAIANNIATNLSAGIYTATVIDLNGCGSNILIIISNPITPTISLSSSAGSICFGNSITINPTGAISYTIGTIPFTSSVSLSPSVSTVYNIVGTDNNNCLSTPVSYSVNVISLPNINIVNIIGACANESNGSAEVLITNTSSTYTVNWSNNSSGNVISNVSAGLYTVDVKSSQGCVNNQNISIPLKECLADVFVPQLFSPNGDGVNDLFVISNIDLYPNNNLNIFNRWGNLVYQKKGYDNTWNGMSNVNVKGLLPASTYFIIIDFGQEGVKNYNGYIQLEY